MEDPKASEIERNIIEDALLQTMEEKLQEAKAWIHSATNPINEERPSHVVSDNLRAKLVPRRPASNPICELQLPEVEIPDLQFMPTPGIGVTSATLFTNNGPPLSEPGSSTMRKGPMQMQTTSIPIDSLVEDLRHIENQEIARKRAAMIKNRRVVQGSVRFAPPRTKRNSTTQ